MLTGSTVKPHMERNISLCCTAMTQSSVYWLKQKHSPAFPSAHSLSGKILGTGFSVHCSSSAAVEKTPAKSMRNFPTAVLEQLSLEEFSPLTLEILPCLEKCISLFAIFCGGRSRQIQVVFCYGDTNPFFFFFSFLSLRRG